MDMYNFTRDINDKMIKQGFFPYRTGNLRNWTKAERMSDTMKNGVVWECVRIHFNGEEVPYLDFLEHGTEPHNIPHAFGFGTIYPDRVNPYTHKIPFGVGGRFNGMFHPGSHKHDGFISEKCVQFVIKEICREYNGHLG